MTKPGPEIVGLLAMLVGAWVVPAAALRILMPAFQSSRYSALNFRGRRVFLGLGIVWVIWAVSVTFASTVMSPPKVSGSWLVVSTPVVLVLLAFIFGLIDDAFGSAEEKGLRGHLRALARGRLTTGALKLIGVAAAALWVSSRVALARWGDGGWSSARGAVGIVAGTVLIAGCANLLNLLDLRPGRALKGYVALFALACIAQVWILARGRFAVDTVFAALAAVFFYIGPVLAVWRYDLGERGMLGDAGANPAGALAGFALVASLPLWGVVIAALAVAALNLASERVSFSQVIERNDFLARLDSLGRLPDDTARV